MAEVYHLLTTPEKDIVQATVNEVRRLTQGDPAGTSNDIPGTMSPEVYLARVPDGQFIPAYDVATNKPGFKRCDLYKIIPNISTPKVTKLNNIQTIHNVYRLPVLGVAANSQYYFQIHRDKFGRWLCERPCSLLAKNTSGSAIAVSSSGAVAIHAGTQGGELPVSGLSVTGYNRTGLAWGTGKWGAVDLVNGMPYLFPWEC